MSRVLPSSDTPRSSLTLKIVATIAVIMLLKLANEVLLPIAIAIILTFLLAPLVRALRARGIDDAIGAAVVVFGLAGLIILLTSRLVQPASEWVARAPTTVQQAIDTFDRMRDSVPFLSAPHAATPPRGRSVAPPQPPPADPVKEKIASESVAITGTLLKQLAGMAVSTIATVMLLYFFLASERWLVARTVEAVPERRARVAVIGGVRAAQRDIATFLGTQAIINFGVAVATSVAMWLVGLPNPTLWGTLAGFLGFIPYLGPLVTYFLLLIAGMLTFATVDWMLAPVAAFAVINFIEANLASPWIVGRRLEMSPLVIFVSVLLCGWIWGIAGAFIAVPLLVAIRAAARRSKRLKLWCVYLDHGREPKSLRFLLGLRRRRRAPPPAGPLGTPKLSDDTIVTRDV